MIDQGVKNKTKYSIIFDTNTLIFGNPFRGDVMKLFEDYKNHPEVDLTYYIPRVVAEEFKSKMPKQIQDARKALIKATKEINGLMEAQIVDFNLSFSDEEIEAAAEKVLQKYNINVLDTPGIDLLDLLNKAIYHKLPFKAEGDAGFKDAVIAETLKEHTRGMSNTASVVVICSDATFRKHLEDMAEDYKFRVYQSVEEFESELKLNIMLSAGSQKLSDSLQKEAEAIFFKEDDKKTLFYKEAWDKINREFPTLFSNPQPESSFTYAYSFIGTYPHVGASNDRGQWSPSDKAKYNIYKPLFIEQKDQDVLVWESVVSYSQEFEQGLTPSLTMPGVSLPTETGIYSLKFAVRWSVRLMKGGKLDSDSAKVLDVNPIKDVSRMPMGYGDIPPTPISGPTSLSGTVTLTYNEN
jgi:rRNA-processing protein FCF1